MKRLGPRGFDASLAALALSAATGVAACRSEPTPPRIWDVRSVAEHTTLGENEPFRSIELGNAGGPVSQHLVICRGAIPAHVHQSHDETVLLLQGSGELRLGEARFLVGAGMLIHIPAGTVHAFRATSSEVVTAVSCFSPAFDGADRIRVEE